MIRRARPDDVAGLAEVKGSLALRSGAHGGFLLGVDDDGYRARVAAGLAWVLERGGRVDGFAIALPDGAFRASEVWARREAVAWTVDPAGLESASLAYYDQLALRRDAPRRWAAALALAPVLDALRTGAEVLVTTTVVAPVENRAAVPFLERIGACRAGRIDERHPGVGELVSEVWLASRGAVEGRLAAASGAGAWARDAAVEAVGG